MAFIILGLYRNMGNGASADAARKAGEERIFLKRQGQRPPPQQQNMSRRSGKKTANKLLSFDTMNTGLQSTINALIQKDGGTSKNFVLLEFRNGIQRNKALIDQLELFNRLILDPDENEVAAQREKRKNFNNSRSVNRVGIWTGAENKQFPAVALQSIVGRYPGLFRQFFRENGTAYDSLLRVASASNEYNFWKYDGSRNIRMNDRGEFDTIVLLCVISPNNDTTYDLDRGNLESRDTRNRNSLYEGLLYAKDKTFRMLAYKTKGKDGDLSRLPVGRPPVTPSPDNDGYRPPDPGLLAASQREWRQSSEEARAGSSAEWAEVGRERAAEAAARQMPMSYSEVAAAGKRGAAALAAQRAEEAEEEAFKGVRKLFGDEVAARAAGAAAPSDTAMTPSEAAAWAADRRLRQAQAAAAEGGGGSRRTKKRKIERTRRRNKKHGR